MRLIGDGSTADTGPQPHQPVPRRLAPGEQPPQFVVFSWDGAANLATGLFPRFRKLAGELGASMTFFLSGIYALPVSHRMTYRPPQHPVARPDSASVVRDLHAVGQPLGSRLVQRRLRRLGGPARPADPAGLHRLDHRYRTPVLADRGEPGRQEEREPATGPHLGLDVDLAAQQPTDLTADGRNDALADGRRIYLGAAT